MPFLFIFFLTANGGSAGLFRDGRRRSLRASNVLAIVPGRSRILFCDFHYVDVAHTPRNMIGACMYASESRSDLEGEEEKPVTVVPLLLASSPPRSPSSQPVMAEAPPYGRCCCHCCCPRRCCSLSKAATLSGLPQLRRRTGGRNHRIPQACDPLFSYPQQRAII